MSKRRGKRVVVGYVVSLSGKRGGPWESVGPKTIGPAYLAKLVKHADQAFGEAEALLADEFPRPAAVPLEARPTVRSNVVVLVPRSTPPRAA